MLQRLHLAHSSDHRLVALVVSSHTLRIWVVEEPGERGDTVPEAPCALEVQTGHVEILGLCFIDDTSLLCVHANGAVQLWRFDPPSAHASGEVLERALRAAPPAESRDVARGRFIDRLDEPPIVSFVAPEIGALLCWEIELGARIKSSDFRVHPETGTLYAAFGGTGGEVLWMSVSASFFVMTRQLGNLQSCVNLTTMCVRGAHVATSCRDHRVALWRPLHDTEAGEPWVVFEESSAEIWALSFSGSARYLAGGGIDNGIYLWDLETHTLRAKRFDHSGWISDLAWSDHDRVLASASWDNSVGVYRGNDLMPLYRLELHTDYVSSVIFIPDTTLLLSASYDRKIAIWDWSQAALVRVFDEHEDWIQALQFSGQGRFMSASSDRRVHLWSSSPLTLRASLVEGTLKSQIENRPVTTAPGLELTAPAMALRADASPSDVGLALDKALDKALAQRAHLDPDNPTEEVDASLETSSSPTHQRLAHKETWPEAPSLFPGVQRGVEEHTENFSVRGITQQSESSIVEEDEEATPPASLAEDSEEELGPLPRPAFGARALRIEGESLSSGRLRSPRPSEESGIHNLQEMSLGVDSVDVFKLIDSHSSSIVIIPSGQSEVLSASSLPSPPSPSSSPDQDATKEINRDALKMLFRRHLDSEAESSAGTDASEVLATAYSQPEQSPEEVTQSLFGDLTEVFEDSLQHYIQNKKKSSKTAASPPPPSKSPPTPPKLVPHAVRSTLTDGERSEALRELLFRARAAGASLSNSPKEEEEVSSEPESGLVENTSAPLEELSEESSVSGEEKEAGATVPEGKVVEPSMLDEFSLSEISLSDLSWPSEPRVDQEPFEEESSEIKGSLQEDEASSVEESSLAELSSAASEALVEDSSMSTLDQALSTPLGEAMAAAEQELARSTTLDEARSSTPEHEPHSELSTPKDLEQERLEPSHASEPVEPSDRQADEQLPAGSSEAVESMSHEELSEQEAEEEEVEDLRVTHEVGLVEMDSSSPEVIVPLLADPPSEFSEALIASNKAESKPNPFTREQDDITVVGDHDLSVKLVEQASRETDEHTVAADVQSEHSEPSLVQRSVNLEEQEFFATPPEVDEHIEPKDLPDDELTALADAMRSQPLHREPSSPLSEDSSATITHAGATQAAAEQALLQGVFEDAFASLHDEFGTAPSSESAVHDKASAAPQSPISEPALQRAENEESSVGSATPGNAFTVVEDDDLPAADDAPTATGSAHPVGISRSDIRPEMATLLADEDSWYASATPVSPGDRTVAEDVSSAPPSPAQEGLGDLPTNPGDVRERTASSGKPVPMRTNTGSFTPTAFSQEERVRSQTRDSLPNPGDQTNPGMSSSHKPDMSGAAPFMGRPATASQLVDEVSANTTSFGGIVYRPEVANEPEKVGNEITADAFPEMEGAVSEPISQSEFISHTPEWDMVSVSELWQLRQATNQSAMKIFKRRGSVSRQPWQRKDPIRADLHNVFAASLRADAEYFCAGGAARHLSVWSLSEELIYQLPATSRIIYALTATPDGRILMSGDDKANIDLWLIDFDARLRGVPRLKRAKFQGHTAPISHLATNSSGRLLLSAGLDGTARLWNLEDGVCVSVLDHYGESLSACDFWGAGLVSVSLEGVLRLWDRRGIQIDLVEGFSPLTCVAAKRNKIYFGSRSGEVFCYERGQTRALGKHDAEVSGMSVHLDGTLISASRDGSIKIHYDDGQNTVTLHARAPLTCIDIDNAKIIAGTENGNVEIFIQSSK